jgi:hypothetical protein
MTDLGTDASPTRTQAATRFREAVDDTPEKLQASCEKVLFTSALPWHTAVRAARDSFYRHCVAWLNYLNNARADWRSVYQPHHEIQQTYMEAKSAAFRAMPPFSLPGLTEHLRRIFSD